MMSLYARRSGWSRQRRAAISIALAAVVLAVVAVPALSGATPPDDPGAGGLAQAIAAQERYTPGLLALPGVVGTAVGLGAGSAPVVKVYAARPLTGSVPRILDGVPVVVEVVGEIVAQPSSCGGPPWQRPAECSGVDTTARFDRPVPIGVSTGHPAVTAGTIGARLTDGTRLFALSNNHVYADENLASLGDAVIQPGSYDGGTSPADNIGTLFSFVPIDFSGNPNRVDAAIALTDADSLGSATPSDGYGTPSTATAPATLNMQVIKYGRTTGQTSGVVDAINATVNVTYSSGTALFTGQVIIRGSSGSFSQGGDSGSLIVTASGHNPVALLFAGNSTITVGNPIDEVLAALGVVFGSGSVSPTTTTTTTTTTSTTTTTTTTTTTQPPGDAVTVSSVEPGQVSPGTTPVTVSGSGFVAGATVTFTGGSGPTPEASNVVVVGAGTLTLDVTVKDGGPRRARSWDVTVVNPDGSSGTLAGGLTVQP